MTKRIVDINNFKCEKCGSPNYRYTHDFDPTRIFNKSIMKVTCLECGYTEYCDGILISEEKGENND